MIGIIGAMDEEIIHYKKNIDVEDSFEYAGIEYYKGKLYNNDVVLVKSGIGKVHAAIATQIMIDRFDVKSVIFTGLAGALVPYLKIGDVVIANFLVQHDVDLTAFGRRTGEIPAIGRMVEADPAMIDKIGKIYDKYCSSDFVCPQLIVGTIASGDSFISDSAKIRWLQREFGAIAAEMEGASVAQVCQMNKIPFVILRTISDSANEEAVSDFSDILKKAPDFAFKIIKEYLSSF
jgi:adenosylhomocysteine nucleosidase